MVVVKEEEEERGMHRRRKACEGPSKSLLSHKFPGLEGGRSEAAPPVMPSK